MNANLTTSTIEELMGRKRSMHLSSFAYLLDELQQDLEQLAEEGDAQARWERERAILESEGKKEPPTVQAFVELIMEQARKVYTQQAAKSDEDFVKDEVFRAMVFEMVETQLFARSKLLWWLEDESQRLWNQGFKGYQTVAFISENLRGAHEGYLAFNWSILRSTSDAEEKKRVALTLCKLQGLVKESIGEMDANGKPPIVQAAALSMNLETMQLLVDAGADPDQQDAGQNENAVFMAARKGDLKLLENMHAVGAGMQVSCNGIVTPMMVAAANGHVAIIKKLVEYGADVNFRRVYMKGNKGKPLSHAIDNNQEEAAQVLRELGAV
mmetsp:Transcript_71081/g.148243  ORF Transcript_71081/g.148243 Transcript_71081/m.148243 type:complete len:326 (+) Transcript_71081:1-978(+)